MRKFASRLFMLLLAVLIARVESSEIEYGAVAGGARVEVRVSEGLAGAAPRPLLLRRESATCVRRGSTEISNALLALKRLSSELLLFELKLCERGEEEDICGIVDIAAGDEVEYTGADSGGTGYTLNFKFENEMVIIGSSEGVIIAPDGVYEYLEDGVRVKESAAVKLVESLPPVLTGLNSYNRPYTLTAEWSELPEFPGINWYQLTALHTPDSSIIAEFAVAVDLSSVYRIDTDLPEPVLIFGQERMAVVTSVG